MIKTKKVPVAERPEKKVKKLIDLSVTQIEELEYIAQIMGIKGVKKTMEWGMMEFLRQYWKNSPAQWLLFLEVKKHKGGKG